MNFQDIKQILLRGIQAPSGENAQPWRFKVKEDSVLLFNNPESDQSLYNYKQSGSLIAHGAFIENVVIAAMAFGYEVDVNYFPDSREPDFVALMRFKPAAKKNHPLEPFIMHRSTNRKAYDGLPLTDYEKAELEDIFSLAEDSIRSVLVEDRVKISKLARAASFNEQMLVDNKKIHDFFFAHVRWNEKENGEDPKGFYIDTLELKPPQVAVFKMLRRWSVARILGAMGISRLVKNDNEKIYNTASAVIGILAKNNTPLELIRAGRVLENIWLTAVRLKLSVQPMAGALFLAESAQEGDTDSFSSLQKSKLGGIRSAVYDTLAADHAGEHVAIMIRIGHGGEPSARSARFAFDHFLL